MGEFFKGWRRKVGCILLMMACVLTSAWIRSLTFHDAVIREGQSHTFFSSGRHLIQWDQITRVSGGPIRKKARWRWETHRFSDYVPGYEPLLARLDDRAFLWKTLGIQVAVAEYETMFGGRGRRGHWSVNYCVVVLLLTIPSAYLILWQPRNAK